MSLRVGPDTANRLVLRKHHLTARTRASDPLTVLEDLPGLHATDRLSPYLQLRARVRHFRPEALDELLESGRAAKLAGMRSTLFIQPRELIPIVYAATRKVFARGQERYLAASGLTPRRYRRLAERVMAALAGTSLDARQLRAALATREALPAVLHVMCDDALLVRWRGPGGWRDARQGYRLFEEALPGVDVHQWDEVAAVRELVRRYICSYGPVGTTDIVWWTGLARAAVDEALASLAHELASIELEGARGPFWLDPVDRPRLRAPVRPAGEIAFLPILDPYQQGYRKRDRYVESARRRYVFDPMGNSTSTILVDGRVAGLWDLVGKPVPELRVFFFERPSGALRKRLFSAAADLARFLGHDSAEVVEVGAIAPPYERAAWVLSPLT